MSEPRLPAPVVRYFPYRNAYLGAVITLATTCPAGDNESGPFLEFNQVVEFFSHDRTPASSR